jgi:outer membrane protein assembly factor BamD (BamD/ComL family)
VLILDASGNEQYRIEGYLPRNEFHARLSLGLARLAVMRKKWADAEQRYQRVIDQFGETTALPEAIYWRGVSRYSQSHDAQHLGAVASELGSKYPDDVWAKKAAVWSAAA